MNDDGFEELQLEELDGLHVSRTHGLLHVIARLPCQPMATMD